MNAVRAHSITRGTDRHLMSTLAYHVWEKTGEATRAGGEPLSLPLLADIMGVSEKTVARSIAACVALGELTAVRGAGNRWCYRVHPQPGREASPDRRGGLKNFEKVSDGPSKSPETVPTLAIVTPLYSADADPFASPGGTVKPATTTPAPSKPKPVAKQSKAKTVSPEGALAAEIVAEVWPTLQAKRPLLTVAKRAYPAAISVVKAALTVESPDTVRACLLRIADNPRGVISASSLSIAKADLEGSSSHAAGRSTSSGHSALTPDANGAQDDSQALLEALHSQKDSSGAA